MSHFPPPTYVHPPDLNVYGEMNQMSGYGSIYNRTPGPKFSGPVTTNFVPTPASCQDEASFQNYLSPFRTIPNPVGSLEGTTDPSFVDEPSSNIEYRDIPIVQSEFQPYTSFRSTEQPAAPGYYRDPYGMPGYPSEPLPNPVQSVYVGAPVRFTKRFPPGGPETQDRFRSAKNTPFSKRPFPAGKRPHSSSGVRNQPPVFYCELCKVSCAGPSAFKDHEAGQRHKKRLSQSQAVERLKQTAGTDGQSAPIVSAGSKELRCELCNVVCTGVDAYNAHTAGKQHLRTLKLHKELGKPIPNTDIPVVVNVPSNGEAKPKAKNKKQKKTNPELSAFLRDVAPIGVEYVEAVLGNNGKTMHYRCKLCDCQFTSTDAKEAHIRGRRHRLQFKKKVDPSLEVAPRQGSQQPHKSSQKRGPDTSIDLNDFVLSIGSLGMFPPRDGNSPFYGPSSFGRFPCSPVFPGRLSAAQIPNAAAENRYIAVKHTTLIPTTSEFNAVKTAVNVCERALKEISDKLYEETCSIAPKDNLITSTQNTKSSDTSQPTDDDIKQDSLETEETSELPDPETQSPNQQFAEGEYRLLSGVIRVGPLGKGLMLKGEHAADLALVCSYWPTVELLNFVASKLASHMKSLDSHLTYTVTPEPSLGRITVNTICPDPSLMHNNENNQSVSQKTPTKMSIPTTADNSSSTSSDATTWPEIMIKLYLTSPAVIEQSNGNEKCAKGSNSSGAAEDQVKRPHMHALIANGHPLELQNCLKTLDMINQTKWFQAVGNKGPMRMVCRIFRDYLQSNDHWIEMDESAVFDHLERLLNAEWYFSYRAGQMPRPFNPCVGLSHPGVVPRTPPSYATAFKNITGSANSYLSPCVLMRRFFESIASGLLLIMPESSSETNSTTDQGTPSRKTNGEFPENRPQFIPSSMVNGLSLATKEKITSSAQQAVRLMAFKQLHKILGMQPFVPQSVLLAQSKVGGSDAQSSEQDTDSNSPKRRRTETTNSDKNKPNGEESIHSSGENKAELVDTTSHTSAREEESTEASSARRITRHSLNSRK